MAKIKLTKNELKVQKDALKMYNRYLPTLMLKKQQLQTEIRTIDAKAKEVRAARVALEKEFDEWIAVFGEREAFKPDMVTVKNIKKGFGNIAGVTIPVYEGADFGRGDYRGFSLGNLPLIVLQRRCCTRGRRVNLNYHRDRSMAKRCTSHSPEESWGASRDWTQTSRLV